MRARHFISHWEKKFIEGGKMAQPLHVLIVEDSEDDTLLLLRALQQGGYESFYERVDTPSAMISALEKKKWDIVISDYSMPQFSGPEALKILKEKNLDIPFIIVSGVIGEETAVSAMKAGAHDYIMKSSLIRLIPAIERELREAEIRKKQREVEEENKRIQDELIQAQKMEALGRLTGGVAHDFNNILTVISGYVELAMGQLGEESSVYPLLKEVQLGTERAANLTRQLLLFSRRQKLEFTDLDFNQILEALFGMLRRIIGEDITIRYELAKESLVVFADRTSMEQMIMNLVVNAKDAIEGGGTITIRTEKVFFNESHLSEMPGATVGPCLRFSVIDTGIGMPPEVQAHIFEPFFTTKSDEKGSGLGLSVVYGIVQQHKGWIRVKSKVNEGSTFEIYLPLSAVPSFEKKTRRKEISSLPKGKGERILVVEDETNLSRFVEKALSRHGYAVFTARNEKETKEIFQKEKGHFHLIFCDVVLPDVTGVELVDQLLEQNPKMRVLLTSGYIDQRLPIECIQEKGYPFLQKPYTLEMLLQKVRECLEEGE